MVIHSLSFTKSLCGTFHYYIHFTDEEGTAKRHRQPVAQETHPSHLPWNRIGTRHKAAQLEATLSQHSPRTPARGLVWPCPDQPPHGPGAER